MKFSTYKTGVLFIALLGVAILNWAFQDESNNDKPLVTKEMLIQKRLKGRVEEFRKNVVENCRERVMQRASEVVDSTLIARAKASRDTIAKPPRPLRPNRPEFRSPTDSTPIKPLLKKDTL